MFSYAQNNINWAYPDSIDPLSKDVGTFLDFDFNSYLMSAKIAELEARYEDADQYYLYLIRYDYRNAEMIYKLAGCYGYLKEYEFAAEFLAKAVNAGYNDFDNILEDKAFDGIRRTKVFNDVIKEVKKYGSELGEEIYIEGSKLLKCRVKYPENYSNDKEYSLVVALHGNGGNADSKIRLGDFFVKHNFIFAAPQGPYIRSQTNGKLNAQYSWEVQKNNLELWKQSVPMSVEYIMNVVTYFKTEHSIKNIYLLGFSQETSYTYITGLQNHEHFKGLIALGGVLLPTDEDYSVFSDDDIAEANHLKVFIGHASNDKIIEYSYGKNAKKRLNKAAYETTFYIYEDGHRLTEELISQVINWLNIIENPD